MSSSFLPVRDDVQSSQYKSSLPQQAFLDSIYALSHFAEAFLILVIASVALRMYVRLKLTRQFGREDWWMVVAFIFALAQLSLSLASCYLCIGLWTKNGNANVYSWVTKMAGVFYVLTLMALKVSVGYFLLNIFSHRRVQRAIIYTIMISAVVLGSIYFPVGFFTCAEIKANLGFANKCPDAVQEAASILFDIFSVVNIVGDLVLVVMSCSVIWEAKLPRATKISVSALLAVGCVGAVASAIRFAFVVATPKPGQQTQELVDIYKWCMVEITTCILAANLVMIRPLFNKVMVKFGLMTKPRSTNANTGPGAHGGSTWQKSRGRNPSTGSHSHEGVFETEMDDAPLNRSEIKREVTVVITDEEKGSSGWHSPLSHSPSFDSASLPRAL